MTKLLFITIFTVFSFANTISVFKVEGMHCPLCTTAVKKAIKTLKGIEKVSVKLNTKKVTVTHKDSVTTKVLLNAIKKTSYEGILITKKKVN